MERYVKAKDGGASGAFCFCSKSHAGIPLNCNDGV